MNRIREDSSIFLEDRTIGAAPACLSFKNQVDEVVAWDADTFYRALALLRVWQKKGLYLAGFISYDAGLILHDLVQKNLSSLPFLHFVAYRDLATTFEMPNKKSFGLTHLTLGWGATEYKRAFDQVKRHIEQGDTYQVNLTSKYHFNFEGDACSLYQILRETQASAYSGLLLFPEYQILTLSPELFFSKKGRKLRTKPMKGTVRRGETSSEDEANKQWLLQDDKSKAENTMIVDLLRNDMSKVSTPGSVIVSTLLEIESYKTVHQMTSTIDSEVEMDLDFAELLKALFPCGSITGAPKKRTMEIINSIETEPRGLYTGAIGYILPNNDMCFNVAIRTLVIQNRHGELGLGGGVVYDSNAEDEYAELKLKGTFFSEIINCVDY